MNAVKRKRGRMRLNARLALEGYLFMSVWIVGFLAFMAFPLVYSLVISFYKVNFLGSEIRMNFVGLDNFRYAFLKDEKFPTMFALYVKQTVVILFVIVLFALIVSILVSQKFPGRAIYRVIFFLPVVLSSNSILNRLEESGEGKLAVLEQFDVAGWLTSYLPGGMAAPLIGVLNNFVLILWYSGVQVLIFMGGMQTISASVYEAARIDGASPWESFWKITLPGLAPFIVLNFVYTTVDQFTSPFSELLTYIAGVRTNPIMGFGYSSALGWIFFLFVLALIGCILLVGRKFATDR
ncbi:carbohydrate ABC transporter permease [Paenibacillus flagellatus]|uniref:Sugar ABC transporter permease n=1 Tax=Paenibacillus flagellatus TaxID=2211139 RepID=A0A2V5K3Y6_9BACL|nr:sugar ABC transporter permease [Paenibacillus flagellatus]PYI53372.1 sugar ABC transporter permease [Paenibacillus flagellatus]